MESTVVGNLPAHAESFIAEGIGVVTLVRRLKSGAFEVVDCDGFPWYLAKDFPVQYFLEGEEYLDLG